MRISNIKLRHILAPLVSSFASLFILAACVSDGPKNSMGRTVQVSAPQERTADQTDLTIGLVLDPRMITKVERRSIDYEMTTERVSLEDKTGKGFLNSQRTNDTWFSLGTVEEVESLAKFEERVRGYFKDYKSHTPPQKVEGERATSTVGYKTIATSGNATCFVGRVAYRFGMLTIYSNERRLPDTIVDVVYCRGGKASFADFDQLLSKLAVMKPEDAAQVRARLPGKTS